MRALEYEGETQGRGYEGRRGTATAAISGMILPKRVLTGTDSGVAHVVDIRHVHDRPYEGRSYRGYNCHANGTTYNRKHRTGWSRA